MEIILGVVNVKHSAFTFFTVVNSSHSFLFVIRTTYSKEINPEPGFSPQGFGLC